MKMSEIYCNENERLKTFQNWPLVFIEKEILAKTGFFFTGDDDKVKCYFCEVEIGCWESTDNPVNEHQRWSPRCPLIRRRTTNNVPIDVESLNRILPPVSDDAVKIEVKPNNEESIPLNSLPNTKHSVNLGTQQPSTEINENEEPEDMLQHGCYNIYQGWITLNIMNYIEENGDNLSTSSQSSEETEVASSEQDAFENEAPCSVEENCDNLSTSSQSCEEFSSEQVPVENEPIKIYEAKLCKICYVAQYETAFSPCGHVVACVECALSVEKCPICRNQFKKVVRLYFS